MTETAQIETNTNMDHIEGLDSETKEFLTVMIAGQRFGIPILGIEDVLRSQKMTHIPLSPPEIAGALNLRGRIVTAIDMRCRLSVEPQEYTGKEMSVVVEHEHELYSLIIDSVGDVLRLKNQDFEKNPPTLDASWRDISMGIYRMDGELLVILDVPKLLETIQNN